MSPDAIGAVIDAAPCPFCRQEPGQMCVRVRGGAATPFDGAELRTPHHQRVKLSKVRLDRRERVANALELYGSEEPWGSWLQAGLRSHRADLVRARNQLRERPAVPDSVRRCGVAAYDALLAEIDRQIRGIEC